jgi:protein involved in polysaccharide export with SLBB domain
VLNDRKSVSVLQAIAMANGLGPEASPKNTRIVRATPGNNRVEIAIDLRQIMSGKKEDVALFPDDILFVPNSYARSTLRRIADTAIRATVYRGLW